MTPPEYPVLGPMYARTSAPPSTLLPGQSAARAAIIASDRVEDYESTACPCGGGTGDRLLSEVDRHGLPSRNVVCLRCGLVRLDPTWTEERYRRFYETEYRSLYGRFDGSRAEYAETLARSRATTDRAAWVASVATRRTPGRAPTVVELGAGGGWNLAAMPAGWHRLGYDVDEEFLRLGERLFGIELRPGFVDQALKAIEGADLVLLSHVVEHFRSPEEVLRVIGRRLREHALLLIEVPGIFRLHGTNLDVRTYLQNAHTFTYCEATLGDTCRRAGLDVLESDEIARAVCRRRVGPGSTPVVNRPWLAHRIIRYLRLCDRGFGAYRRLRDLPVLGKASAQLWKRTYFASLGALVPRPFPFVGPRA
jgi:SAM-dependent methyltransferase